MIFLYYRVYLLLMVQSRTPIYKKAGALGDDRVNSHTCMQKMGSEAKTIHVRNKTGMPEPYKYGIKLRNYRHTCMTERSQNHTSME